MVVFPEVDDNAMNSHNKNGKKKPRFFAVDFFCGAGGTTRGLIDAGGYVIAGVDKDERCKPTYTQNNTNQFIDYCIPRYLQYDVFPHTEEYPDGQQDELLSQLKAVIRIYRKKAKNVPMLFAICAPCQPFTKLSRKELSEARKAARARDTSLLTEAAKFVDFFRPELVLSENVAGIKQPQYGGIWDGFRAKLEALGYLTGTKIVCTSRFGIPQFRKRSILIGVRKDLARPDRIADLEGTELLVPEADPDSTLVSVKQALDHLPPIKSGELHPKIPNHLSRALSELNLKRISVAKPGEPNSYMESTKFGDLSLNCHRKVNEKLKTRCFTDVYTRMCPDRPSPTITTKCHSISNGRFGHYDTAQDRGISLREAAILQSFPDNYIFYPTDKVGPVAKMIGNAVPPRLAAFYANYLANSLCPTSVK